MIDRFDEGRGREKRNGLRTARVEVRLTPDEADALEQRARALGLSVSSIVRRALLGVTLFDVRTLETTHDGHLQTQLARCRDDALSDRRNAPLRREVRRGAGRGQGHQRAALS